MTTISRNFNGGIEISENGLNKLSVLLYQEKPELFEAAEDIPIGPSTNRVLGLYAFLDEPLKFDFYPSTEAEVNRDTLFAEAALTFTLSDKQDGDDVGDLITKISMRLNAILEIDTPGSVNDQEVTLSLNSLEFTEFRPDHPFAHVPTPTTTSIAHESLNLPSNDPAFVAILNYLIDVFLKDTLRQPIAEFPFPPINILPDQNVSLYMRALAVWGDKLGAYLDLQQGAPREIVGNAPTRTTDLSIGVTESVLSASLRAILPIRVPIDATPNNRTLSIRGGSWLEIKEKLGPFSTNLDLRAPDDILATLFFRANLNAQINVKLGKYWVPAPFTLPIGDGSFIRGRFNMFAREESDEFKILMRPSGDFFEPTAIVIVTDFRNYFRRVVRDYLRRIVKPIWKKIPILGWIIDKTVGAIIAELIAFFAGAILDGIVSTFLTTLLTGIFNGVRIIFTDAIEFEAFSVPRIPFGEDLPIPIKEVKEPEIVGNAGGEIVLTANFEGTTTLPRTEPEMPIEPRVSFSPIPEDEDDGDGDEVLFPTPVVLNPPQWPIGETRRYRSEISFSNRVTVAIQEVVFSEDEGAGTLLMLVNTSIQDGETSEEEVTLDKTSGKILKETQTTYVQTDDGTVEIETSIEYDYDAGVARRTFRYGEFPETEEEIQLPDEAISILASIQGAFQIQLDLSQVSTGTLTRIVIDPDNDTASFTPVAFETSTADDGTGTPSFVCSFEDIEYKSEMQLEGNSPFRLLTSQQDGDDVDVKTELVSVSPPGEA